MTENIADGVLNNWQFNGLCINIGQPIQVANAAAIVITTVGAKAVIWREALRVIPALLEVKQDTNNILQRTCSIS